MRKSLPSGPLLLLFVAAGVHAESFHVVGWNVESGDNDRDVIAEQIAAFQGCDLVGLSEVREENADTYAAAAAVGEGASFAHVVGRTSSTSDHRPVACTFETEGDSGDDHGGEDDEGSSLRDQILARIRHIEEELSDLRELVKRLGR